MTSRLATLAAVGVALSALCSGTALAGWRDKVAGDLASAVTSGSVPVGSVWGSTGTATLSNWLIGGSGTTLVEGITMAETTALGEP